VCRTRGRGRGVCWVLDGKTRSVFLRHARFKIHPKACLAVRIEVPDPPNAGLQQQCYWDSLAFAAVG